MGSCPILGELFLGELYFSNSLTVKVHLQPEADHYLLLIRHVLYIFMLCYVEAQHYIEESNI